MPEKSTSRVNEGRGASTDDLRVIVAEQFCVYETDQVRREAMERCDKAVQTVHAGILEGLKILGWPLPGCDTIAKDVWVSYEEMVRFFLDVPERIQAAGGSYYAVNVRDYVPHALLRVAVTAAIAARDQRVVEASKTGQQAHEGIERDLHAIDARLSRVETRAPETNAPGERA